jgi:hypothetical protein
MADKIEKYMLLLGDLFAFDHSDFGDLVFTETSDEPSELSENELEYVAAAAANYQEFLKRL